MHTLLFWVIINKASTHSLLSDKHFFHMQTEHATVVDKFEVSCPCGRQTLNNVSINLLECSLYAGVTQTRYSQHLDKTYLFKTLTSGRFDHLQNRMISLIRTLSRSEKAYHDLSKYIAEKAIHSILNINKKCAVFPRKCAGRVLEAQSQSEIIFFVFCPLSCRLQANLSKQGREFLKAITYT